MLELSELVGELAEFPQCFDGDDDGADGDVGDDEREPQCEGFVRGELVVFFNEVHGEDVVGAVEECDGQDEGEDLGRR